MEATKLKRIAEEILANNIQYDALDGEEKIDDASFVLLARRITLLVAEKYTRAKPAVASAGSSKLVAAAASAYRSGDAHQATETKVERCKAAAEAAAAALRELAGVVRELEDDALDG